MAQFLHVVQFMEKETILGIFLNKGSKLSGMVNNIGHQDCGWVNDPCLSIEQYATGVRSMGSSLRMDEAIWLECGWC